LDFGGDIMQVTRLVTLCEVCNQPKIWHPEQELYLLYASAIECPNCEQKTKISRELKEDIKRVLGMQS
jgi:hypothetical protein